jgi:RNA polymerase sigma-70 factor (ECF subfamily)
MTPPLAAENTPPSDEDLMAALVAGDSDALDALMLRWQKPLQSFLQRHLQNEADALDLAQETFVRIFLHRARYRPGARFSTWLFQIALNLARDHARKHTRRRTASLEALTEPSASGNGAERVGAQFSDPAPGPADAARHAEEIAAVRAALLELPEDLRALVVLSEYERLPHAEIAAIVGGTAKAVEGRLARARAKLRATLATWLKA